MSYQIHAEYETGDSNGRHDTSTTLEMVWEDLEKAKAALKRLEEHYRWYDGRDSWEVRYKKVAPPEEPAWHVGLPYDFTVKVLLDNGAEVQFLAPWCGYFERLRSLEIVRARCADWKVEF